MSARRFSLISALLLTAALLYILPWLWRGMQPGDTNRMDERLRPARTRTLTVWLMRGEVEDEKLLSAACAAFEKENAGVRVFLRVVGEGEWASPDAVLPDVALFTVGSVVAPEKVFVPLSGVEGLVEGALSAGTSGGVCYAAPLWFAPNVLSLPGEWFSQSRATPAPTSLLGGEDMGAEEELPGVLDAEALPWQTLLSPGALTLPNGVALEQLLFMCPISLRSELSALSRAGASATATSGPASGAGAQATASSIRASGVGAPTSASSSGRATGATAAPSAASWSTSVPVSRSAPTPTPVALQARVMTLARHLSAVKAGERRVACALSPVISERVRLAAVCREGDDARAFLRFLLSEAQQAAALSHGLMPLTGAGEAAEPLTGAMLTIVKEGAALPNAFAHTLEELRALCLDGFARGADPVETLLRLR